jgi:hypothetical protein
LNPDQEIAMQRPVKMAGQLMPPGHGLIDMSEKHQQEQHV